MKDYEGMTVNEETGEVFDIEEEEVEVDNYQEYTPLVKMTYRDITPPWNDREFNGYDDTVYQYKYSSYAMDRKNGETPSVKLDKEDNEKEIPDLSKVEYGKNYRYTELCEVLGVKEMKRTNVRSIDYQMKRLSEFVNIDRPKRGYFALSPLPETDGFKSILDLNPRKTAELSELVYQSLLCLLAREGRLNRVGTSPSQPMFDYFAIRATPIQLKKLLGFASDLFFQYVQYPGRYFNMKNKLSEGCFTKYVADHPYSTKANIARAINERLLVLFKRSLEHLHKFKGVEYYYESMVMPVGDNHWRVASRQESQIIESTTKEVAEEYNLSSWSMLRFCGKQRAKEIKETHRNLLRERGIERFSSHLVVMLRQEQSLLDYSHYVQYWRMFDRNSFLETPYQQLFFDNNPACLLHQLVLACKTNQYIVGYLDHYKEAIIKRASDLIPKDYRQRIADKQSDDQTKAEYEKQTNDDFNNILNSQVSLFKNFYIDSLTNGFIPIVHPDAIRNNR